MRRHLFERASSLAYFPHMKSAILGLFAVALLTAPGFADSAKKMICTDTGKEVKACCCSVKNGQFVCKFTNKTYDKCCCESKPVS